MQNYSNIIEKCLIGNNSYKILFRKSVKQNANMILFCKYYVLNKNMYLGKIHIKILTAVIYEW